MSRYGNHANNQTGAVAINLLQSISSKEDTYKQSIYKNHAYCKGIGQRLTISNNNANAAGNDSYEQILIKATTTCNNKENNNNATTTTQGSNTSTIIDTDKIQSFLQEQRERLKNVTKLNIENERTVHMFCNAVTTLKDRMILQEQQNDETTMTITDDTNYQELLEEVMEQERTKQQRDQLLDIEYEGMYREICETLGEPIREQQQQQKNKKGKKRSKGRRSINDDDDDDETIMVMTNSSTSGASLQCPITGTLMDDPVKNKVCHHVYSRAGIMDHIRVLQQQRTGAAAVRCPVAGCQNCTLSSDQLEDDYETTIRIRQERRRQERRAELAAASEAHNLDDDDDDDEDDDEDN